MDAQPQKRKASDLDRPNDGGGQHNNPLRRWPQRMRDVLKTLDDLIRRHKSGHLTQQEFEEECPKCFVPFVNFDDLPLFPPHNLKYGQEVIAVQQQAWQCLFCNEVYPGSRIFKVGTFTSSHGARVRIGQESISTFCLLYGSVIGVQTRLLQKAPQAPVGTASRCIRGGITIQVRALAFPAVLTLLQLVKVTLDCTRIRTGHVEFRNPFNETIFDECVATLDCRLLLTRNAAIFH